MATYSNKWGTVITTNFSVQGRRGVSFAPGLFLIVLGLVVVFAPRLLIGAVASLFIFVGVIGCYVAWKVSQFKKRLRDIAQQVEVRYHSEGDQLHHPDIELEESEYKKIVFH